MDVVWSEAAGRLWGRKGGAVTMVGMVGMILYN